MSIIEHNIISQDTRQDVLKFKTLGTQHLSFFFFFYIHGTKMIVRNFKTITKPQFTRYIYSYYLS